MSADNAAGSTTGQQDNRRLNSDDVQNASLTKATKGEPVK